MTETQKICDKLLIKIEHGNTAEKKKPQLKKKIVLMVIRLTKVKYWNSDSKGKISLFA